MNVFWTEGDAVGPRTSIDLIAPGRNIYVLDFNNVDTSLNNPPGVSGTSYAAPHVTGAVAQLQQLAKNYIDVSEPGFLNDHSQKHEVMKAVILNAADKIAGVHGSQRTILDGGGAQAWIQNGLFEPLHPQVGAGHLNTYRAVLNLDPGEYEPGPVPLIGWDYSTVGGSGATQEYLLGALGGDQYLAATLIWDKRNVMDDGGSTYTEEDEFQLRPLDAAMNNLDLYLTRVDSTDPVNDYIWASRSFEDNVEHIFFNDFPAGQYKLVVRNNEVGGIGDSQNYALAWWFGSGGSAGAPGDFNSDGSVDAADYVMWRKDNGVGSYADWVENFGSSSGSGGEVSVPESPTSLLLIAAILCVGLLSGRRLSVTGPACASRN